jgi:hypothetical protein
MDGARPPLAVAGKTDLNWQARTPGSSIAHGQVARCIAAVLWKMDNTAEPAEPAAAELVNAAARLTGAP